MLKNIELQINRLLNQPAAFYLRGGGHKKLECIRRVFDSSQHFGPRKEVVCLRIIHLSILIHDDFQAEERSFHCLGRSLSLLCENQAVCLDLSELRFSLCQLRLAIIWLKTETNWHLIILFNRTQSSGYCAPIIIDLGATG